jgi:O-antigen/teichoic acid export membrane protein
MLTQNQVGLYSLAFYITDVVRMNIASVLNRVMFTQYAALQNMAEVRYYVIRTMSFNALILLPLMLALTLAGPIILPVVLGDGWRDMGLTLQLLALSVMISAVGGTTSTVFKALGRPGVELSIAVLTSTVLLAPALIVGVHVAGIAGAAAAIAFKVLLSVVIRQIVLDRLVGSTAVRMIKATAGSLLVQLPIVAVWLLVMHTLPLDEPVRAVAAIILGLIAYAALLLALRRVNSDAWPAFSARAPGGAAQINEGPHQ